MTVDTRPSRRAPRAAANGRRNRSRPSPVSCPIPSDPGVVHARRARYVTHDEMHAETIDTEAIKVKSAAAENGPPEPLIRAGPWGGKRDRGPDQRRRKPLSPAPAQRGDTRLALAAGWLRPSVSVRPSTTGPDSTSHTDTATDDPDDPARICPCTPSIAQEDSAGLRLARRVSPGNDYVAARSSRTSRV